jgi:hypothetical protein
MGNKLFRIFLPTLIAILIRLVWVIMNWRSRRNFYVKDEPVIPKENVLPPPPAVIKTIKDEE